MWHSTHSTFGEQFDAAFRLRECACPEQTVPYTGMLEGVDDPHVPASLLKLWLHELVDPLATVSHWGNDCSMGMC
jgi:hypothetical protein